MIHLIADKIVESLNGLSFVDKITGITKPLRYTNANTVMVIPVAFNTDPSKCSQSQLLDYVPDSTKTSIIYFEDLGTSFTALDSIYYSFTSQIRLMCWFNYKKLGAYTEPSMIALNLFKHLPDNMGNFDNLIGVWIDQIRQEPNDGSPFNRYTYKEHINQYITYPYDYVSLVLTASYKVAKACIDDIIPTVDPC